MEEYIWGGKKRWWEGTWKLDVPGFANDFTGMMFWGQQHIGAFTSSSSYVSNHRFYSRKELFCFQENLWEKNCIFFAWANSRGPVFSDLSLLAALLEWDGHLRGCSELLGYTSALPGPLDGPTLTDCGFRAWSSEVQIPLSLLVPLIIRIYNQVLGKHIRHISLISRLIEVSRVAAEEVKAGSDSLILSLSWIGPFR